MTMGDANGGSQRRWYSFWSLLPAALLALGTALALSNSAHGWSHRLTTAAVAVLVGLWMWLVVLAHPQWMDRLAGQLGWTPLGPPVRDGGQLAARFQGPSGDVAVAIRTSADATLSEPQPGT